MALVNITEDTETGGCSYAAPDRSSDTQLSRLPRESEPAALALSDGE